jgi:uncharacterized protein with HEPN domain
MPPTLPDRLVHILDTINDIQTILSGATVASFAADKFQQMIVERSFEIIYEESRHLPANVKAQQPEINWQGMVDFGNRLRHAYHRVDANLLWQIAERDLPPLKAFVERAMRESAP